MQSRGFRGKVGTLDDFRMHPRDWIALGLMLSGALVAFLIGR